MCAIDLYFKPATFLILLPLPAPFLTILLHTRLGSTILCSHILVFIFPCCFAKVPSLSTFHTSLFFPAFPLPRCALYPFVYSCSSFPVPCPACLPSLPGLTTPSQRLRPSHLLLPSTIPYFHPRFLYILFPFPTLHYGIGDCVILVCHIYYYNL